MPRLKHFASFVALLLSFLAAFERGGVESFQYYHYPANRPPQRQRRSSVVAHHSRRLPTPPLSLSSSIHSDSSTSPLRLSIHLQLSSSSSSPSSSSSSEIDPLIYRASVALRASSWFSWWSQLILTVVSSITFLFARNVLSSTSSPTGGAATMMGKFLLPGLGIVVSSMSLVWTWGQRRLARRFLRGRTTSRIEAANLLRRTVSVGTGLNLVGLLTSVLGAQVIVGTLAAKSMQIFVGGVAGGIIGGQTLQPLDVLIVQANTNILSSHFVSLACLLWLNRMIDLLDPPSLEDDDDV
ncbi:hypothetical protein ACHAXA_000708 [Cyclostephanos tholiformis]|uniref:Transmembrane protein n=1 Tax=Cyclostephanos tholiformis TaxID=382380 RepID=A0ABD3R8Y5_9STRA